MLTTGLPMISLTRSFMLRFFLVGWLLTTGAWLALPSVVTVAGACLSLSLSLSLSFIFVLVILLDFRFRRNCYARIAEAGARSGGQSVDHEIMPDRKRSAAAVHAVHGFIVVIANPYSSTEVGSVTNKPGIDVGIGSTGFTCCGRPIPMPPAVPLIRTSCSILVVR